MWHLYNFSLSRRLVALLRGVCRCVLAGWRHSPSEMAPVSVMPVTHH
jgi:hypothetical protein